MINILTTINERAGGRNEVFQRVYAGMTVNSVSDLDSLGGASVNAYEQFQANVLPASLVEDANLAITRLAEGMMGEHHRLSILPESAENDAAKELYMRKHNEYTTKIPELGAVLANHTFDM